MLSLQDHIETYMGMLRERELAEFDFVLQDQLLQDFQQDPAYHVSKWNDRIKADE